MLTRFVVALAGVAVAVTAVHAQSDVLPSTAVMRDMGQAFYRDLNNMVKGEAPYDQAKAAEAYAKLTAAAAKISASFPESSKGKTSANTRFSASPKVWEDKAAFDAAAAKLTKEIADNRGKVGTLDGLKAAYPAVSNACNACHEGFRLRRS
jgi:cytochrome c556